MRSEFRKIPSPGRSAAIAVVFWAISMPIPLPAADRPAGDRTPHAPREGSITRSVSSTVSLTRSVSSTVSLTRSVRSTAGEVWLISTRQAPRAGRIAAAPRDISYHLLLPNRTWREADRTTFVAAVDPAVPTTIFIHGNRTGRVGALCDAWRVYRRMQKDAAGRPFRLVVWSWPSDRIAGRQRYDVQVKDCYSDAESWAGDCRTEGTVPIFAAHAAKMGLSPSRRKGTE